MAQYRCSVCGAELSVQERNQYVTCEYCDNKNYIAVYDNDAIDKLKAEAIQCFLQHDYSLSIDRCQRILVERPTDAEIHWFLALSCYGVEFVVENHSLKRTITCRRTSYDSILENTNYLYALEYTDQVTRKAYEKEALVIDQIQKKILSICENEPPYDIFISYKEKELFENRRTRESELAEDLYYLLQRAGYHVFYAPVTLREIAIGAEYEPYIFAALNTARIMYVIGFTEEHLTAVWVKNEWSRFLERIKVSRRLKAVLYYNSLSLPQNLIPPELAHSCELIDASESVSISDIAELAFQRLPMSNKASEKDDSSEISPIDFTLLESLANTKDFKKLWETCDSYLDFDPENSELHFYLMMAELGLSSRSDIQNYSFINGKRIRLDKNRHFLRAMKYADPEHRTEYENMLKSPVSKTISEKRTESVPQIVPDIVHNSPSTRNGSEQSDMDKVNSMDIPNITPELAEKILKQVQSEEKIFFAVLRVFKNFVDDWGREESNYSTEPYLNIIQYLTAYKNVFQTTSRRYLKMIELVEEYCIEMDLFETAMDICQIFYDDLTEREIDNRIELCKKKTYLWMSKHDWATDIASAEDDDTRQNLLDELQGLLEILPPDCNKDVRSWHRLLRKYGR